MCQAEVNSLQSLASRVYCSWKIWFMHESFFISGSMKTGILSLVPYFTWRTMFVIFPLTSCIEVDRKNLVLWRSFRPILFQVPLRFLLHVVPCLHPGLRPFGCFSYYVLASDYVTFSCSLALCSLTDSPLLCFPSCFLSHFSPRSFKKIPVPFPYFWFLSLTCSPLPPIFTFLSF